MLWTVTYPDLSYNIFTNRWYGEMFVNQTIGPQNFVPVVLAGAQVMNAVQTDNYWLEDYVQQEANGQTFPAYAAQDALPLASPKIGADCGGTGCPANYYYDPLLSPRPARSPTQIRCSPASYQSSSSSPSRRTSTASTST